MKKTIIFLVIIILLIILLLFSWRYILGLFLFQAGPNLACISMRIQSKVPVIVQDSNTCVDSKGRISINLKGGADSGLLGLDTTVNLENGSHMGLQIIPGQELPAEGKENVFYMPPCGLGCKDASSITIGGYVQDFMTSKSCGQFQTVPLVPCKQDIPESYSSLLTNQDPQSCFKNKEAWQLEDCVLNIARKRNQPQFCDLLPDKTLYQLCQEQPPSTSKCDSYNKVDSVRKLCHDGIDFSNSQTDLKISSPSGGEIWKVGETHEIIWTARASKKASIKIENMSTGKKYTIADNIDNAPGDHSYSWNIGNFPKGEYGVEITELFPVGFKNWEMSNYFTIALAD